MRNRDRSRLSYGTMIALTTTVMVIAGCCAMFIFVNSDRTDARLAPEQIVSAINRALNLPTETPSPMQNIKTVTVTLAPTSPVRAQATIEPTFKSLTVTVAGEVAFQSDIMDALKKTKDATYTLDALFSGIADSVNADLNIVSLSNVLYADQKPASDVNADPSMLASIKSAGFTFCLPANESALNFGIDGVRATIAALRGSGLGYTGLYGDQSLAGGMAMLTVNNLRIAVLHYVDASLFKNNVSAKPEFSYAVTAYSRDRAALDISSARANGAEIVVVSMHWGKKDAASPSGEQMGIAEQLITLGANVVIGTHPTAVQPVAFVSVTGADGAMKTGLVAYSMGSLIEESRDTNEARSGMLLHFQILVNATTGEVSFAAVEYTPVYTWKRDMNDGFQFRVLKSAAPVPTGMSGTQVNVMARSLQLIQSVMQNSPATQRD